MNEDIYLLLDGDLSDTDSAVLFRQLSESSQERLAFRQQLRLQNALNTNGQFNTLTTAEDADILARLAPTIGLQPAASAITAEQQTVAAVASTAPPTAGSWFSRRAVVMLLIGFAIGGGLGVTAGRALLSNADQQVVTKSSMPQLQQPIAPAAALNRDSLIAALRDSLRIEMANAEAEQAKQPTRKKLVRRKHRPYSGPVTGE